MRLGCRGARRGFSTSMVRRAGEVRIVEVSPRDGLQNESTTIPLETKVELIRRLTQTGLRSIEAGSFVAPKWVPQMANSSEVLNHLFGHPPTAPLPIAFNFLVPNLKGLHNFLNASDSGNSPITPSIQLDKSSTISNSMEVSLFTAATETFSKTNTNCTIAESLERCRPIVSLAKSRNLRVRGYVSVALGCPYEGPDVSPAKVAEITATLLEMGADEISVADTTGMGTGPKTQELLKTLFGAGILAKDLALHFHDTYGQALVNAVVGLEQGIRTFDSSVGGLGGCPYSKGATGNVATEDLLHCLHSLGATTGVDVEKMAEIGKWICKELGRPNDSRAGKAILARLSST
ncbi:hydroxymethylglutaryl-CoA lyase [Usnea florida]